MRMFELLECFNGEIYIQMYDLLSKVLLYEGKIEDIPHKVSRMRDIVLGAAEIKNGVLTLYTKICCGSNPEFEEMSIKIFFSYDEEAEVWIGEGREEYEGIILEGDSLACLFQKMEVAIEDWNVCACIRCNKLS